jgi:ssDNA-binding Zn-finger/Zn-ribbon topoisomerase 1
MHQIYDDPLSAAFDTMDELAFSESSPPLPVFEACPKCGGRTVTKPLARFDVTYRESCGSVGLSRRCFYAHQMREELKNVGWKHVAVGGKDFCPKCKPRRKPRRRSRTTVVLVNSERKTERG